MNKRFTIILVVFLILFSGPTHAQIAKQRPNVIFIITDDQSNDTFGFLEHKALTPRIDRMAKEGIYFSRAYVASSVCTPSRYTCMTGQYVSRCQSSRFKSGFTDEGVPTIAWNMSLVRGQKLVSSVLQDAGYRTGFVGKWHVAGGITDHSKRVPPGSDPSDPEIAGVLRENHEGYCRNIRERFGYDYADAVYLGNPDDDRSLVNTGCNVHNMEWLILAALRFIESSRGEPFFLYFSPTLLHWPPPEASLTEDPRKCGAGLLEKPITGVLPSRESVLQRVKQAGIPARNAAATWLDDGICAILDKLDELGIAENTLVIYFNDNGMETHAKGTCYEGGITIPVIAQWKGHLKSATNDLLISNIDFVPTFLDVCGAKKPADMVVDGVSLLPLLKGKKPVHWRQSIYSEIGYTRSVTTKDWKYIAFKVPPSKMKTREERLEIYRPYYEKTKKSRPDMTARYPFNPEAPFYQIGLQAGGTWWEWMQLDPEAAWHDNYFDPDQLYHLAKDPLESTNLAENPEYADKLREMKDLLAKHLENLPGTFAEMLK